ncbi:MULTISPECIES: hypothetical protein [unclassified Sphingopyxis]|uniref:hypothetical protein n=1 Tax=unclassified Sphingopyxis TaxID=2614943 RepID=UPI0024AD7F2F|nr:MULTISPECIES: hypothetical protein [unclassified Sphingopyxis]
MDLSEAISEPFVQLIDFHNAFNRGIKVSYGAMIFLADQTKSNDPGNIVVVPTGSEPWGGATRWRDLDRPLKEASIFISEMGITRAAAAFENYLIDAKSEFDRANLQPADTAGTGASALKRLDALLGANTLAMRDLIAMVEFFDAARNCVVHRSNVASDQLARLRNAPATLDALTRWPKRTGKWTLSLPSVVEDQVVEWQPRHAIFASDVFYRCARALDQILVDRMGPAAMARMAAHWCFIAVPPVPCPAKLNPETMVRRQLTNRYRSRTTIPETVALLKQTDMWDKAREAWNKQYPDGPETAAARHRRARRARR